MMCSHRFINCNQCTTLVVGGGGVLVVGEFVHVQEVDGKSLYLPLHFSVNLL